MKRRSNSKARAKTPATSVSKVGMDPARLSDVAACIRRVRASTRALPSLVAAYSRI